MSTPPPGYGGSAHAGPSIATPPGAFAQANPPIPQTQRAAPPTAEAALSKAAAAAGQSPLAAMERRSIELCGVELKVVAQKASYLDRYDIDGLLVTMDEGTRRERRDAVWTFVQICVPDIESRGVPAWKFYGYGSAEAMASDEYVADLDAGPTHMEMLVAATTLAIINDPHSAAGNGLPLFRVIERMQGMEG